LTLRQYAKASMRRTMAIAALAWCLGMCTAATLGWGYAMLDAWRGYGDQFQTGYIVGFFDAVTLAKRQDQRVWAVPAFSKPNYERWRGLVNDYFADPANAKRSVPDAMAAVGKEEQKRVMEEYKARRRAAMSPSPGSSPATTPVPTGTP
jgi:hypothetical protein